MDFYFRNHVGVLHIESIRQATRNREILKNVTEKQNVQPVDLASVCAMLYSKSSGLPYTAALIAAMLHPTPLHVAAHALLLLFRLPPCSDFGEHSLPRLPLSVHRFTHPAPWLGKAPLLIAAAFLALAISPSAAADPRSSNRCHLTSSRPKMLLLRYRSLV